MTVRKMLVFPLIAGVLFSSCSTFKSILGLENHNPKLQITVENTNPPVGSSQQFTAVTEDEDGDNVTVSWSATAGEFSAVTGHTVTWTAPQDTQTVIVTATAEDSLGGKKKREVTIHVGNAPPVISGFSASVSHTITGNSISFSCTAADPEGMPLSYRFYSVGNYGTFRHQQTHLDSIRWTSPMDIETGQEIEIVVEVSDPLNLSVSDTVSVLVYSNYGSLWVLDGSYKTLSKYTGNGIKIFTSAASFTRPVAIVSNSRDFYGCFVADQQSNTVSVIDYNGNVEDVYTDFSGPIDMDLHESTQRLYVLNYDNGSITIIDNRTSSVVKTISGFAQPTSININQRTGEVWVLESGNNRVIRIDAGSDFSSLADTVSAGNADFITAGLNGPAHICINRNNDGRIGSKVYVVDRYDDQIEVMIFDGTSYTRSKDPVDLLSHMPVTAGITPINLTSMVISINAEGKIEAFEEDNFSNKYALSGSYGFAKPEVLVIDKQTGDCWIADNGRNQLVKIKFDSFSSFSVLRKLGGFLSIKDIALNK